MTNEMGWRRVEGRHPVREAVTVEQPALSMQELVFGAHDSAHTESAATSQHMEVR